MENYPSNSESSQLRLDEQAVFFLRETSRWAYFLSIVGFIAIGLMVLLGLFLGTFLENFASSMPTTIPLKFLSVVYLIIAAIYLIPVRYLYRFAVHIKYALRENNHENLNAGFANMKSLFRFMGIFTIAIISIYLIIIISAMVFGLFLR
jgi:hypothetical protein